MEKATLYSIIILVFLSGCTQVVTAPIEITGAVVGATIDVADSAVDAVMDDDEEDDD